MRIVVGGLVGSLLSLALAQEPIPPGPVPLAKPQQAPASTAPPRVDPTQLAAAMTESMRLSTPGEEHKRLTALAGHYDVAMTLSAPGMPAEECRGEARAASVLGGRYLILECGVTVQQARLQGIYIFGFDNLHGLYTASWRDSMSTWSVECSGSPSPEHRDRVELSGTMVDAATPTGRPFRMVLTFGDEALTIAVVDTFGGAEKEVVRQQFTRRKPKADEPAPGQQGK